ncbi:L-threonylcarbamoyladenylate synthase [Proteiniborus sp. MB09-C3]|uniref:L-threonylcarbamoyladenylate synthase n=1 Tax=Proteiniborus sp. MB09-C3 TaxID=3050072 RepID=UPI0025527B92|nr:L-threonylcarbamoyladenylate synthase [Proteiniborus sp. MB09-C3]WIV12204.1 L-threonylcarbamoyladenylate synthase [Proteiniborus sp. MB09-C3]
MKEKSTNILSIDPFYPEIDKIMEAAEIIKNGGTVAFPTETVYGLGANALEEAAVKSIYLAKGRPQDNPLIVHISSISQLEGLVEAIPQQAYILMEKFWPGPLTLIFRRTNKIPDIITGGLSTVAIRMPNHNIALELIRYSKLPIAAPSANTSGKPSPTNSSHVIHDLSGKIDMIIDGGSTGVGLESTVLDISGDVPTILRPGGITIEDLLTVLPKVEYDKAIEMTNTNIIPKSPGQKYKHYSPDAKMVIVRGNIEKIIQRTTELCREYEALGMNVGIMATKQTYEKYQNNNILIVGDRELPETIAANLFNVLREFDKIKVDIIIAEAVEEKGIGKAIMNRMKKAAGGKII